LRLRGGESARREVVSRDRDRQTWRKDETRSTALGPLAKLYPLMITGLGELSKEDIQDLFADCGRVALVKRAGRDKERVIVYFESRAAVLLANNVNGTDTRGVTLRSFTLPPVPRSSLAELLREERFGKPVQGYPVVINEVPLSVQEGDIISCACKIGEIVKIRQDKKLASSWWVTFKDKKAARAASKNGMGFGPVHCKVVRVRPEALLKGTQDKDKKQKQDKRTALVRGIPLSAQQDDIMSVFEEFGKIEALRIMTKADPETNTKKAFISFATKTALKKARKASLSLHGSKIGVSIARKSVSSDKKETPKKNEGKPIPIGCNTVLVKNLPYSVTRDKIRMLFTPCGHVKAIRFIGRPAADNDRPIASSGKEAFKGMAYVEFDFGRSNKLKVDKRLAIRKSVQAAMQLEGTELMGRKLRVDWAHGPEPHSQDS